MDELVTDLTIALERTDDPQSSNSDTTIGTKDSPSSTPVRKQPIKKRRGRKRRSDFPLSKDLGILSEESNDSIEEALKDYIENISMCQSDSDEDCALSSSRRLSLFYRLSSKSDPYPLPELERQDSHPCNDSLVALSKSRRGKKMKRAAQQSGLGALQSNPDFVTTGKSNSKGSYRRTLKRKLSNRIIGSACGETWTSKSKYEEGNHEFDSGRSNNEAMSVDVAMSRHHKSVNSHGLSGQHGYFDGSKTVGSSASVQWEQNEHDDVMAGSDSDSSSDMNESEGFFTNDEGRLGDDEGEESTFEQEPNVTVIPWWENDKQTNDEEEKFQNIVNGVMNEYGIGMDSATRGGGFQARLNSLKSMYETNNMKPLVEINRKINKFLHDPSKSELSIPLTNINEREQIFQLASLYSLHCRTENLALGRIILLKTRNTCKPNKQALNNLLGKDGKRKGLQMSEVKRARRMPLPSEGPVGKLASAIPESNIGNKMLRSMGWVPGTGLGPDKSGIVDPIGATLRPRKLGLGHVWPT